ncbi:AGAP010650-PA-like protein [Anopheles sinensis]|uniref:AGAP010650-PA-like protein n=1 Tax=Anopheles sinensis TaxID=74873 RepID=A0A084W8F5_ANOSI|nr:AGAP010650-PA-like protein [Anopheles sinensis]
MGCAMLLTLAVALAGCAVVKSEAQDGTHLYLEKSLSQAMHECMEYLQIPANRYDDYASHRFPCDAETKCLVRCVGLNLRWWNDTTGVQTALMANFFQPDPTDTDYARRTAKCLELRLAQSDPSECCSLAYESFMCYLQHYGNLVPCPQYLPEDHSRYVRMAYDCINMLQVPEVLLHSYSNGLIRDAPETRCLLRCFYLRSGVFNSETGFDLRRLYTRDYQHADDVRYLASETYAKLNNLRATGCDECTEVFLAYRDLLGEMGNAYYEDGVLRDAAVLALKDGYCDKRNHHEPLNEEKKQNPKKYHKKTPTKVHYPKQDEAEVTTRCHEKTYEEATTTPKYYEQPTTTPCPVKHQEVPVTTYTEPTMTTHCPPKHHEEPTTNMPREEPTTTTLETSTPVVFNYKQRNCENCGKMFQPGGCKFTCPNCTKSFTKYGRFFF